MQSKRKGKIEAGRKTERKNWEAVSRNIKRGENKTKLKCFYTNARSIVNKRNELELYIMEEKPDIVAITETWAVDSIDDSELKIEGYTMIRRDRILGEKTRGGGVLLYIIESVNVIRRDDIVNSNILECVWCEIVMGGEKSLIGVCYRAPDSTKEQDEALYQMIGNVDRESILLMGDFNFPELDWREPDSLDDSHPFMECINDNFLFQCVESSTRAENMLDLVLVSEENGIEDLKVGEPFSTSDHQILRWNFIACRSRENVERKEGVGTYDYFKADYDKMREEAQTKNWSDIMEGSNVDAMNSRFILAMEDLRDKYVTLKKNNKKIGKCKWVNRAVVKSRRAKIKAWNKYQLDKTDKNLNRYKQKLKISRDRVRKAKRSFERKLADNIKNDSKSFYAYVRSKQRTKDRVGPLKDQGGEVIIDDEVAANILNDYFSSVFTIEDCSNIPEPAQIFKGSLIREGLFDLDITSEMVEKKLEKLNVSKCPGLDGMHPKMLYELRKEITGPMTQIFRCSLITGVVPKEWREAGVTPLFKKGKKSEMQNYRPVSLTSIICKIMESLLKDAILGHLDKFKLIRNSQHGFTKGRSCLTNLLDFLEEVTATVDEGTPVDIIYLDFAKAFDKVPHQRLSHKILAHGIGGDMQRWIKNWLADRRQKVCVNKIYSGWQEVRSGVPQGSVLGPLLFLIYINDLDEEVVSKVGKFADDTKMCRGVALDSEVEILRNDLKKMFQWSIDWQMLFNADKCTVMHMGKNNLKHEYKLGEKVLRQSKQEIDLGVVVDDNGKSAGQCAKAVKKANAVLGMIKRNIYFKSKDVIVKLYKSLVRPRLEYCIQAWSPYLKKDIDRLERVQRRATRMIEGYWDLSYEERLEKTGLIPLDKRRVRGDLIEVFKMMKGIDHVDFENFFKISNIKNTRGHCYKLSKQRCKGERRRNFFTQRVINHWNKLPQEVIEADSVNSFKNKLDKLLKH